MHIPSLTAAPTVLVALAAATLLANSAEAASYKAPKGNGTFQLEIIATGGNLAYSGNWRTLSKTSRSSASDLDANDTNQSHLTALAHPTHAPW